MQNQNTMPDYLQSGTAASLFPNLSGANKEGRITSIFLAVLAQVPELSREVLGTVGVRVGGRAGVRAFTEVVFRGDEWKGERPDGLIVVEARGRTWSCLVETKIGKGRLDAGQVHRYVKLAKAHKIDAVITISNEFVSRAEHSPVVVPKSALRKVNLFHWSWVRLHTICGLLSFGDKIEDPAQKFILDSLNRFLGHPETGIERFMQMDRSWKDVVRAAMNDEGMSERDEGVVAAVYGWLSEERDLSFRLSRHIGREVKARDGRKSGKSREEMVKHRISTLASTNQLTSRFRVPNCVSDLTVCADLSRRTISASMVVDAPGDRKSTKARVNWLLRQLPQGHPNIRVQGRIPNRGKPVGAELADLRADPGALDGDGVVQRFEVVMTNHSGKRFSGPRTFIEDIERLVPEFYDLVGSNLKAWQASPPKPVRRGRTLGERLRRTREDRGMTQAELEQACGRGPSWATRFETGARQPSDEDLALIASVLGVTADLLAGAAGDASSRNAMPGAPDPGADDRA